MVTRRLFLAAAVALVVAGGAMASAPPGSVVSLRYTVRGNDPEKLEANVTVPVERIMRKLERVAQINTSTSEGTVDVEIGFQGGATEQDLAAVTAQIEMLEFGDDIILVSRTIALRAPRLSFDAVQAHP